MTTLTKDAIKQSFMKLLNQKSLSKITVKEIVEDCGINRNSFYYHYDDIPSLVEEILNEQVDEIVSLGAVDLAKGDILRLVPDSGEATELTVRDFLLAAPDLFSRD